jgi:hypothetical protein
LGVDVVFSGNAKRVEDIFRNWRIGYLSCLATPKDSTRLKCLDNVFRWIHQMWVMKLVSEALGVRGVPNGFSPAWWISQGDQVSLVADSIFGRLIFFFEFDPYNPVRTIVKPILEGVANSVEELSLPPGLGKRPDIVVFRETRDLRSMILLVECKNGIVRWDSVGQIFSYIQAFRPRAVALASMRPVSRDIKMGLEDMGVLVFDELDVRNRSRVEEFKRVLREYVSRQLGVP